MKERAKAKEKEKAKERAKEKEKESRKAEKVMAIADNGWLNKYAPEEQLAGTITQLLMDGHSTRKLGRRPKPRENPKEMPQSANGTRQESATRELTAKNPTTNQLVLLLVTGSESLRPKLNPMGKKLRPVALSR